MSKEIRDSIEMLNKNKDIMKALDLVDGWYGREDNEFVAKNETSKFHKNLKNKFHSHALNKLNNKTCELLESPCIHPSHFKEGVTKKYAIEYYFKSPDFKLNETTQEINGGVGKIDLSMMSYYQALSKTKEEIFKGEINIDPFDYIEITKNNIADYYEFMGDELRNKYSSIVHEVLELDRQFLVFKSLNIDVNDDYIWNNLKRYHIQSEKDEKRTQWTTELTIFGIKDNMKPIDEYIVEIEKSPDFQKYATNKILLKIQNNEEVPSSEFSKIDFESEAFKALSPDIKTTITDYINEQSDKIVNAALEEDRLKQEQNSSVSPNV